MSDMTSLRFSADFEMFGPPGVGTLPAIERAASVGELAALDLAYPFPEPDLTLSEVQAALEAGNLEPSVVTPEIATTEFERGSFTNPDRAIRHRALQRVEEAADVARQVGAEYVKLWVGRDGYDYPFQVDYAAVWDQAVSGVRSVAEASPDVLFAIEYKAKEPRTHLLFGNAARTLTAVQEIDRDNIGIVVDFGHSLFAQESPADAVELVSRHNRLAGVEFNDNFRVNDDDLTVGAVHLVETLEFIYVLRRLEWQGYWELDQTGVREDPVEAARRSITTIRTLHDIASELEREDLRSAQAAHDAMATQKLVYEALLHSRKAVTGA